MQTQCRRYFRPLSVREETCTDAMRLCVWARALARHGCERHAKQREGNRRGKEEVNEEVEPT